MSQEVSFGTGIARGVVGDSLEAGEHARAGGLPAPLTAIPVELEEGAPVQDDEGEGNPILIRRRDVAVDISKGISSRGIRLVEPEFHQELEEVLRLELPADVGGIARGQGNRGEEQDQEFQEDYPATARPPPFTSYQWL